MVLIDFSMVAPSAIKIHDHQLLSLSGMWWCLQSDLGLYQLMQGAQGTTPGNAIIWLISWPSPHSSFWWDSRTGVISISCAHRFDCLLWIWKSWVSRQATGPACAPRLPPCFRLCALQGNSPDTACKPALPLPPGDPRRRHRSVCSTGPKRPCQPVSSLSCNQRMFVQRSGSPEWKKI